MNFIKRGFTSVLRKPGKTIILLLIVFVLGNVISFAISVGQAVDNTEKSLRQNIGVAATVENDYDKLNEIFEQTGEYPEPERLTPEVIKQIGQLPHVKSFDYSVDYTLHSKTLQRYFQDKSSVGMSMMDSGGEEYQFFSCLGVNDPEVLDLKENKIKLLSGRVFNQSEIDNLTYVALVSQEFANLNNLNVGSKMQLSDIVFDYSEGGVLSDTEEGIYASQDYDVEIIGIFEPVEQKSGSNSKNSMDADFRLEELQNRIYLPNMVLENASAFSFENYKKLYPEDYKEMSQEDSIWYRTLYILNDSQEIEAFREEALALAPEMYQVVDSSESFSTVTAPMKSIQWISNLILIGAVAAALIILSLLITLFLRDRKHEIGIYLSLGERKIKIVSQVVLEVVAIAVVGIVLALFSGNLLSGGISKTMLRNEIVAQEERENQSMNGGAVSYSYTIGSLENMGYGSDLTTEDLIDAYKVSLDPGTVLLFFAVGIGTVVVSTLVPIIYILRLNPKKILL